MNKNLIKLNKIRNKLKNINLSSYKKKYEDTSEYKELLKISNEYEDKYEKECDKLFSKYSWNTKEDFIESLKDEGSYDPDEDYDFDNYGYGPYETEKEYIQSVELKDEITLLILYKLYDFIEKMKKIIINKNFNNYEITNISNAKTTNSTYINFYNEITEDIKQLRVSDHEANKRLSEAEYCYYYDAQGLSYDIYEIKDGYSTKTILDAITDVFNNKLPKD